MTKAQRRSISMGYFAKCIVQEGIAKGKSEKAIRSELMHVCECSEVLRHGDVETIMEIGQGRRVA